MILIQNLGGLIDKEKATAKAERLAKIKEQRGPPHVVYDPDEDDTLYYNPRIGLNNSNTKSSSQEYSGEIQIPEEAKQEAIRKGFVMKMPAWFDEKSEKG